MIRPVRLDEMGHLLALWLDSTTLAHPFITPDYWQESLPVVRDTYLPHAETWVSARQNTLDGFISIIDQQFIGALFVAPDRMGKGIGRELIAHAQQRFAWLSLEVYQKNLRAVHFYHARGFRIEDSAWQDDTHQPTWIMNWQADQRPLRPV